MLKHICPRMWYVEGSRPKGHKVDMSTVVPKGFLAESA